jgi:hypothetical protein
MTCSNPEEYVTAHMTCSNPEECVTALNVMYPVLVTEPNGKTDAQDAIYDEAQVRTEQHRPGTFMSQ